MTGFTGVVWDARTTERLAADLVDGAGPAPLAEAGLAWGQLAGALAEAGMEYGSILARIGVSWESAHSDVVHRKLASLTDWFTRLAGDAVRNAALSEGQAAAVTVARLTMPNIAETDLLEKMRDAASATSAVAPALMGVAAQAERALHDQRMRAARVMSTYEVASEPVAHPWMAPSPAPAIVSPAALHAEQAARSTSHGRHAAPTTATPSAPGGLPMMPMSAPVGVSAPLAENSRYAQTILAGGSSTVFAAAPAPAATPSTPMAPPPMAPAGMATATERTRTDVVDNTAVEPVGSAAAEAADAPETWADVAAAENPVAHHVSGSSGNGLDSRYVTEKLSLSDAGGGPR